MKRFAAVTAAVLFAVPAFAQQTITPETTAGVYMSAMGPYNVNVEHRLGSPAAAQAGSIHDKDAELFVMLEGTATLVTGGKLIDGVHMGDNWRGKGIEGGKSQKMSKGDFMMVPAGVPHWFTNIDGQITEFSLHLPAK